MVQNSARVRVSDLRSILLAQNGRCAISGKPLEPEDCSLDHIVPLSRPNLNPNDDASNVWLVCKDINRMKGALSYDELVSLCRKILANENITRSLMKSINDTTVPITDKEKFDEWVAQNCDDEGRVFDTSSEQPA